MSSIIRLQKSIKKKFIKKFRFFAFDKNKSNIQLAYTNALVERLTRSARKKLVIKLFNMRSECFLLAFYSVLLNSINLKYFYYPRKNEKKIIHLIRDVPFTFNA